MVIPFRGVVTSLNARAGQRVKAGQVLARYRLAREENLKLRRRVSPRHIKDLGIKLADIERKLIELQMKQKELKQLAQQNMAAPQSLTMIDKQIKLLTIQREIARESLSREKELVEEDLRLLKQLLGAEINATRVPDEAALVSPIAGIVVWVHPELRIGEELNARKPVLQVSVMDPMLLRARVHEIEAVQLKLDDAAEFTLESIPDRTFQAKVSRISWTPLTPKLDEPSYYEVELEVPNPDLQLKEGLKGRIVFKK
jgi:multidrug efflux pump subunit AcrA (membrane-fusion protein)